jgi:predicted  nucleic acid-binding Zn-ribbon protein
MSSPARPELVAFHDLETLVRHLGEELASFRRRALLAEAQLRDAGHAPSAKGRGPLADRLAELERENQDLRDRIGRAEERVRQMTERVRFLRQQLQSGPGAVGAAR